MAPPRLNLLERIAENSKQSESGCILWTGSVTSDGYGVMGIRRNKQYRAHRITWEIANGREIPDGIFICHTCDTPLCVNADHLFLGTPRDNMLDMVTKGRRYKTEGESHPMCKLTNGQVDVIRALRQCGRPLKEIAARYGISFQHVSAIYRGVTRA